MCGGDPGRSALCVVYRFEHYREMAGGGAPSARLFRLDARELRDLVRRLLTLLPVPSAESFTLKGFRAGKAPAMIAGGSSLRDAMEAGEWKSAAVFSYLDESVIDASRVLHALVDESDDE